MKIRALPTATVKAVASGLMILAINFAVFVASQPSLAQYTAGHACGGPIGPKWDDSTLIDELSGAGTVRVNMLANLEALINIGANCAEIIAIIWGLVLLYIAFQSWRAKSWHKIFTAALLIKFGLSIPECVNWMIGTARDASLFS